MTSKALATLPTAFLAGVVGPLGYHAFERWAFEQGISLTRGRQLAVYGVFVAAPFVLCVVGIDTKRWEANYWFGDSGKADMRRMWIRWAVYVVGGIVGYAMSRA